MACREVVDVISFKHTVVMLSDFHFQCRMRQIQHMRNVGSDVRMRFQVAGGCGNADFSGSLFKYFA